MKKTNFVCQNLNETRIKNIIISNSPIINCANLHNRFLYILFQDGKSKSIKDNYDRLHRIALNSHPRDFEEPKVDGNNIQSCCLLMVCSHACKLHHKGIFTNKLVILVTS